MTVENDVKIAQRFCSVVITYENGPIAQRLEQGTHNPLVPGSNPGGPTNIRDFGCAISEREERESEAQDSITIFVQFLL